MEGVMEIANPITTEPEYTDEETVFIRAMEKYQHDNRRQFPTYREVLAVVVSLGYRKVVEATELPVFTRRPFGGKRQ